mmetsp:Transcript_25018/g.46352  ORF Transcript_25018/g.46352 Transcript_25018/m.46352 type:complete len:87 (+) Transcript_25018:1294-1554(+)
MQWWKENLIGAVIATVWRGVLHWYEMKQTFWLPSAPQQSLSVSSFCEECKAQLLRIMFLKDTRTSSIIGKMNGTLYTLRKSLRRRS